MRTETKEYTVYDYNDLLANKELKGRVLEKHWDINVSYEWWDWIIEEWNKKLENLGFENPEIQFSGFWSQGDGASFTADINVKKFIDTSKVLTEKEKKLMHWLVDSENIWNFGIYRSSTQSVHEESVHVSYYSKTIGWAKEINQRYKFINKVLDKFENELENLKNELCGDIYHDLETSYSYLTSEEAILETIQANEYEFLEDGTIA